MKMWRKLLMALAILTGVVLCLFGGWLALARHIGSQRSCEYFNIDNIELHTEVDIPAIKESDCNYDSGRTVKQAWFRIDKQSVNLDRYILRNKFLTLPDTATLSLSDFLDLDTTIAAARFSKGDLYYTKGSARRRSGIVESWKTLLDKRSGKLWATIYYNDKQ
jgi:hypothetical protein